MLGPDLVELLRGLIREEVEAALADRENGARWMTPQAAARRYGVSASSLRKRCARNSIRHTRLGRRLLIDVRDLDRKLAENHPIG